MLSDSALSDRYNLFTLKELLPSIGNILHIFLNGTYEQKVTVLH